MVTGMIDGLGGYEKKEDWIVGEMGIEDGRVCMIPMHAWSFRHVRNDRNEVKVGWMNDEGGCVGFETR